VRGEYDHLVPLELGGAPDDPRNLWFEPGPTPNPKDAVENKMKRRGVRRAGPAGHSTARHCRQLGDRVRRGGTVRVKRPRLPASGADAMHFRTPLRWRGLERDAPEKYGHTRPPRTEHVLGQLEAAAPSLVVIALPCSGDPTSRTSGHAELRALRQ
jgi:hypothetical protein